LKGKFLRKKKIFKDKRKIIVKKVNKKEKEKKERKRKRKRKKKKKRESTFSRRYSFREISLG